MEIDIIQMSSKGQIVIPALMRQGISKGDKFLLIREGDRFILKPLEDFEPSVREDILFAKETEKAFLEYEKGKFITRRGTDFIDDLESW